MMIRLAPLALPLVLSACVVPIPLPVPEGTPGAFEIVLDEGDSCGARGLQSLVGQDSAGLGAIALVAGDGRPVPVRVVGPDGRVVPGPGGAPGPASDPARVSLGTDAAGTIVTVGCG